MSGGRRNVDPGFSADADERERLTRGQLRQRKLAQQEAEREPEPAPSAQEQVRSGGPGVADLVSVVPAQPTAVYKLGESPDFVPAISGTPSERLAHYERTIGEAHMAAEAAVQAAHEHWVLTAGQALREIRDEKLFTQAGYASFDEYVQARWGFQKQHASRLIQSVPVVQALRGVVRVQLKERQVRALVPVVREHGADAVRKVWQEAERRRRTSGAGLEEAARWLGFAAKEHEETPELPAQKNAPASMDRLQRAFRYLNRDAFRTAATENPAEVRRIVADLRELLDSIENELPQ